MEIGRWTGRSRCAAIGNSKNEGATLVVGSLVGLLVFMLALNLSNAQTRHDLRMTATLHEINAISTAMQQAAAAGERAQDRGSV